MGMLGTTVFDTINFVIKSAGSRYGKKEMLPQIQKKRKALQGMSNDVT